MTLLGIVGLAITAAAGVIGTVWAARTAARADRRAADVEERLGGRREDREDFNTLIDRWEKATIRAEADVENLRRDLTSLRGDLDAERAARIAAERRAERAERQVEGCNARIEHLERRLAAYESADPGVPGT